MKRNWRHSGAEEEICCVDFFFFFSSRLFLFLDTKNNRLRVSFFFRQAVAQAASRVLFGARFIIMITNGDSSWCLGR